jgi:hypothetical protein
MVNHGCYFENYMAHHFLMPHKAIEKRESAGNVDEGDIIMKRACLPRTGFSTNVLTLY